MTPFYKQIDSHPPFFERQRGEMFFEDLLRACAGEARLADLHDILLQRDRLRDFLISIMGVSPFLRGIMLRQPGILRDCLFAPVDSHVDDLCAGLGHNMAGCTSFDQAMTLLRVFKQQTALSIALYDIAGVRPLEWLLERITAAADCAVREAVSFLFRHKQAELYPDEPVRGDPAASSGYFVLAMGKQGGFELNYSSDIDLIVLYDTDRVNLPTSGDVGSFFVRLTRDLVKLLNERTADGYVYRTDLRLRPDPGATQLAISSEAALVYYESFGQNWERAAMIKARIVAGDRVAGQDFLSRIGPYIWRKYLDFATLNDIHAMKRQIHAFRGHGEIAVAGHNIKLGRGGIREIEFFVQTQQLIAGGRQPALRGRRTLTSLESLQEYGWISKQAAEEMSAAYVFLRHVEHRLQMIADERTQTLPEDENELLRLARFAGFDNSDDFAAELMGHLGHVQKHYGALFEDRPDGRAAGQAVDLVFTGEDHHPATITNLQQMGYGDGARVIAIVREWHRARYGATRSQRARELLTGLIPILLEEMAATRDPDAALLAFDRFLKKLPAGVQLFSLLHAHPQLLRLLAEIMGSAPRLAHALSRQPRLLDAVLDPSFFGPLPGREEMDQAFEQALAETVDYSDILDRVRIVGREQGFLIGVRVLTDTIRPEQAGQSWADLAASALSVLQGAVDREMYPAHGHFDSGGACILAMGKVGGREMTASSDLDLIVIYETDADEPLSSGGRTPLGPVQYYNRWTQRLMTAISAPTPEGILYEVDLRLRPSGNAGPLATGFESFSLYQHEKAWTWEHMALTRGRVVSGPPVLRQKVETLIRDILCRQRDAHTVARDVVEMRQRIWTEKGSENIWDIKQVRGGLVDLEFIAQTLQLVHAHEFPHCLDQNTAEALRKLAGCGVLEGGDAEMLIDGAWLLHVLTQILRLCYDRKFEVSSAPEGLKNLLVRAADSPDFAHLEARLRETQETIHRLYDKYVVALAES